MAVPKTPEDLSTVKLDELFQPFEAYGDHYGDHFDIDKVITPSSFYELADQLQLEEMFVAARQDQYTSADTSVKACVVPDMDNLDTVFETVPSTFMLEIDSIAQVPSSSPLKKVSKAGVNTLPKKRKRAKKIPVPGHLKDAKYYARRKRNNEMARRNRMMKKKEKEAYNARLPELNALNTELVDEVSLLKSELQTLRAVLRTRLEEHGMSHLYA